MSAAKHTQGPLQVLDHPQDGVFILDAGSRTLAKVVYLLNPHERMANAHLFAAAPEHHEASLSTVERLANLPYFLRRENSFALADIVEEELAKHRAAIAKAQGSAS